MNIRSLASALLVASILAVPALRAEDASPAPAPAPAAKPEKTALEKDMDKVNKAFRALRKQIKDPAQNDSSLALVATIHDSAEAASKETPKWTADKPAADQAKFVADYQAGMKKFLDAVDQLTAALKAGDNAGADKLVTQLAGIEREEHKQFRKPEKD